MPKNKTIPEYFIWIGVIALIAGFVYFQSITPKQINSEAQREVITPAEQKAALETETLELQAQKLEIEKQLKIKAKEGEILELKNQ